MDEMPSHYREAAEQDPLENFGTWVARTYPARVTPCSDPADDPAAQECYGWTPLLQGGEIDCEATRYTRDEAIVAHAQGWLHTNPIMGWLKYVGNHCFVAEML